MMIFFSIFLIIFTSVNSVSGIQSADVSQNSKVFDTSHQLLSRNKRWLVWKEGVNWVALIFGIGIPFEVNEQSVTLGMLIKAYYQVPNNSSYYTRPTIDFERKKRSSSRWLIYEVIENFLERNNYPDGKACLLKSICEVSAIKLEERSGLLAEIVHSILTPSSTNDEIEEHSNNEYHAAEKLGKEFGSCSQLFPECPMDPIQQFSRFMTISKYMY